MSAIMTDKFENIRNSYGKAYLSVIMALTMLVINVVMHDNQYAVFSARSYLAILIVLVTFIYLYRKQVAINDKQYLEEMIEHHSMALLTSEKILEKTDSYNVAKIAKNIIQRQNDEIVFMKSLVQDIETKS
jgi:Ca2+/Na+ antiporter